MLLALEPSLKEKIEKQYEEWMACCPNKKKEADAWIKSADEDEAVCMKYLYAYMHPCDIVSYDVEVIASYVKATLDMYANVPYAKRVPAELFFTYVLCVRVNNEDLDKSREWIYRQLVDRVKDKKTMVEAALEVNYWCYEKATYIPSDDRTLAPFGMCNSARGRCGEESTLAVSAMRSVGIPARQCYVPRWAHCDDNHAWVEVWADGDWHYLGACEPEPVLDKGWFTAAASKAMLVHAKAFSDLESSAEIAYKTPLYALMNVTERYADCAKLTVTVTDHGVPVQNVSVLFCLVNYSELFPLHKEKTAADGSVSFMTGKGDLYVCTVYNGKYLGQKIDMREQQSVVLKMEQASDPEKMEGIIEERFDLNPPIEAMPKSTGAQMKSVHEARLAECEKIRADYEESFVKEDKDCSDPWNRYFVNARGNRQELEKFRQMTEFTDEDKRLMLDTLRDKDFLDTTAEVLASYLRAALPYKNNFCTELYQKYLLAPRAGHEKLMGSRSRIASLLSEKKVFPQDGTVTAKMVWEYVNHGLNTVPDYGTGNWPAEADGCIKCEIITEVSKRVVFVEICRRAFIDFLLSGLDEDLIAVFGRCAAYRIDDRICHIACRILEIGCERVLAARSERDSHEVGKFRHILGTVGIDVDSQCLFGILAVYVVVSLDGLRLRFLIVGDVDGDCVKHDVERVAVHITCKTSAVCVFGSCSGQIDGCRIPNDLRAYCVFVIARRIIGLHLFAAEIDREFDVCVLREYRCVEERAVAKRDRHRRTVRLHCIARSCCRIVDYDFGGCGDFVCHLLCAFRIVEVQHTGVELLR